MNLLCGRFERQGVHFSKAPIYEGGLNALVAASGCGIPFWIQCDYGLVGRIFAV
jgi:hypothetical protein